MPRSVLAKLGHTLFWVVWPISYVVLRYSWRTRAAIIFENEVLVLRPWLSTGKWSLPGGGLNKNENVLDGLRREIQEEVGLTLPADEFHSLGPLMYRASGLTFNCHLFGIRLQNKPVLTLETSEIREAAWLKIDTVSTNMVRSEVPEALKRLAAQG